MSKSEIQKAVDFLLRASEPVAVQLLNGREAQVRAAELIEQDGRPVIVANRQNESLGIDFFFPEQIRRVAHPDGYVLFGADHPWQKKDWSDTICSHEPCGTREDVFINCVGIGAMSGSKGHLASCWPPNMRKELAQWLLAKTKPPHTSGAAPLIVCELCGDFDCGALSARVRRSGPWYIWDWVGPAVSYGPAPEDTESPSKFRRFRFEAAHYESFVHGLLG